MKGKRSQFLLSESFIKAIREHQKPLYRIAVEAGSSPTSLSNYVNRNWSVDPKNPKLKAIADMIGFTGEIAEIAA